jgi:hypothetical protein
MFATNALAAMASRASSSCDRPSRMARPASSVQTSTRPEAGSRRRARRAQKFDSDTVPVVRSSRSNSDVMRKPDRTKNTSTPMNPPAAHANSAW